MHGMTGGPSYKPKKMAHDPRKAPIAIKGVKVGTSKTKGKGR